MVLAVLSVAAACVPSLRGGGDGARGELERFLSAWSAGDTSRLREATGFDALHAQFHEALQIASSRFEVVKVDQETDAHAIARVQASHQLRGLGDWTFPIDVRLAREEGRWRVQWSPALLHPEVRAGDRLSRTRTAFPPRAELFDGNGEPLTREGEVVAVGLNPARVRDAAAVARVLQQELSVEPKRVQELLELARGQEGFRPVIELRPERFASVRPALEPVPGIFFRKQPARLTPYEGFAAHTLGRVGEITAELLAQLGEPYQAGDRVGLSGLERAFEAQLAGRPGGEVRLTTASGVVRILHAFEQRPGEALRTTLQPVMQRAADDALAQVKVPAALVAVRATTGEIVAVASRPLGGAVHRALVGRYPPGSTFKIITTEALLERGVSVDSRVECPAQVTVQGKVFKNFEGEAFGQTDLRTAFAHSCNTAFIRLVETVPADVLERAAARFGFGVGYEVGLPTGASVFPSPGDRVELAAAAIGQGRVLATPVHLASVAAAAFTGTWRAPTLLRDADPPSSRLSAGAHDLLPGLMRAVVTQGSARSAAGHVPGLAGKTGTAEFGTEVPPRTHAWFVGYRSGIAFAVLLEGGGVGGRDAAPIAAKFAGAL